MIQAEDILMGTKSLRHYAAHTGSWISIIAATSSRQSQLPRGEGPGLPQLPEPGGAAAPRSCHSQLLPMFYLCQDTPDQRTIKPFYKGWLQKQNAKWQQLAGKFHRQRHARRVRHPGQRSGHGGWQPLAPDVPHAALRPWPKAGVSITPSAHRHKRVHLLQWI